MADVPSVEEKVAEAEPVTEAQAAEEPQVAADEKAPEVSTEVVVEPVVENEPAPAAEESVNAPEEAVVASEAPPVTPREQLPVPDINVDEAESIKGEPTSPLRDVGTPLNSSFVQHEGTGETPVGVFADNYALDESMAASPLSKRTSMDKVVEEDQKEKEGADASAAAPASEAVAEPAASSESETPPEKESTPVQQYSEEELAKRRALVEAYKTALSNKDSYECRSAIAQNSIAEILRKRQKEERRDERDRSIENLDERYAKYLAGMKDLERDAQAHAQSHLSKMDELRQQLAANEAAAARFDQLKLQTAQNSISQRTGRAPLPAEIKEMLEQERAKEKEVAQCRLDHLRLQHRLNRAEEDLRLGEQLGDGLHLIDFEQLKLENQTYNEKIEERNEDVIKLRTKIASTVNILSHIKEALQFAEEENLMLTAKLRSVESAAAQQRDKLSRTKRARDSLKDDNLRLKQQGGLVGDELLLRDMEGTYDGAAVLRQRLQDLSQQYEQLQLAIKETKIRNTSTFVAAPVATRDAHFDFQ